MFCSYSSLDRVLKGKPFANTTADFTRRTSWAYTMMATSMMATKDDGHKT